MLTPEERAELEDLTGRYIAALKQIEMHGKAVAAARNECGPLLVAYLKNLFARYPIAAVTCHGYLIALLPRAGKELLFTVPATAIYDLDADEGAGDCG